ncbi:hypothetical protein E5676_scaffold306G002060 [Cucumis melo var. makuwa]|uniref:Reverse transcriptase n=1 Tax=Cucumis melo var. makuwa TaxID=1194695 RepID=A0A5A7TKR6_CUCMM|nr:hypothetical protein E6C27_scaffold67G004160 [Cucumis melo var. makuwa]TYK17915.1 hypothetical protein E5676_scaffold306G002060 [Cucumis melo var. makuwa]
MQLEIPLGNGKFTWSQEGASIARSVLDRFFINEACDDEFENTRASRQARLFSDHFPILVEYKEHGLTGVLKAGQVMYLVTS